jgi:hypothetical protein
MDDGLEVDVVGEFDPARFEANSPNENLSGQAHVFIAGIAKDVMTDPAKVELRPLLVGFPIFCSEGRSSRSSVSTQPSRGPLRGR